MRNFVLVGFVGILVLIGFEVNARPCERCHGVCCISVGNELALEKKDLGAQFGFSKLFSKTEVNGHMGQCSEEESINGFIDRKVCKGHPLDGRICFEFCVLEANEN